MNTTVKNTSGEQSLSQVSMSFGEELIAELQELEVQLMHSGRQGLLSLIAACICHGWDTERAIVAKIQQLGGPYYDQEIRLLLQQHSSPLARPHLWDRDHADGFVLRETSVV